MNFLITIGIMLFSVSSLASENLRVPEAGKLVFQNRIQLELKRRNEVVFTGQESGKLRLADLRKQEYFCEYKGRETHLCSKFFPSDSEVSEEILDLVRSHFSQEEIEFFPKSGEPELISKGESYAEFFVPQRVRLGQVIFESYRYGILQNELHKIIFGKPAQDGLIALPEGKYQKIYQMRHRVSKDIFEQYMFSGDFQK
jgi:hypothetical protein